MSGADPTFTEVLKEAFNVRVPVPLLGDVPINWLFLAAATVGTLVFPPLGLIAAGIELALLYGLTHNERFQNYVRGRRLMNVKLSSKEVWAAMRDERLKTLNDSSKTRFELLEQRVHKARRTHAENLGGDFDNFLEEGLHRLESLYLSLLSSLESLHHQVEEGNQTLLEAELADAEKRFSEHHTAEDRRLAKSLGSTIDILKRRLANLATAEKNLAFIESELRRIEHQTELIIEEAALAKDPDDVAHRIDAVTSTFDETQNWIKENRDLMKEVGFELESEAPRIPPSKQGLS